MSRAAGGQVQQVAVVDRRNKFAICPLVKVLSRCAGCNMEKWRYGKECDVVMSWYECRGSCNAKEGLMSQIVAADNKRRAGLTWSKHKSCKFALRV